MPTDTQWSGAAYKIATRERGGSESAARCSESHARDKSAGDGYRVHKRSERSDSAAAPLDDPKQIGALERGPIGAHDRPPIDDRGALTSDGPRRVVHVDAAARVSDT